jgi:hypothetical protein
MNMEKLKGDACRSPVQFVMFNDIDLFNALLQFCFIEQWSVLFFNAAILFTFQIMTWETIRSVL